MKKAVLIVVSGLFVLGILFPVEKTSEGPSPFINQIKSLFHYDKEHQKSPRAKEYPTRFERDVKKQLRYPADSPAK